MLNQYIEYPYIVFPFGLAKPALVITIAYICVLTVFLLYRIRKNKLLLTLHPIFKMKRGEQNKVIVSVVGFAIMVASCTILPSFLANDNIILSISNIYLQFEPLLFLILFLFICTTSLNKINPDKQIKASNTSLNFLIWVSIFTGIITGQLDYTFWQNIVVISCAGIIIFLLLIVDIKAVSIIAIKEDKFDMIPYAPVQSATELFPQHKIQAEDIANIILNSSSEPFSICVSGEWGTGKTSVVYGAIDILKSEKPDWYEFIHINALELDNKNSMMQYLFSRIEGILKDRGVYVGVDSEYKDFISSSAGVLTSIPIGTLIHKKFFKENDDYRFQKEKLEKVLRCALGNGKLIVVIDDIERCDKKIAREYLFLIKEVATMQSCVSIFVTDYDILNKLVYKKSESKHSDDFLSKFFNYRIDLVNEQPEDVFNYYDKSIKEDDPAFQSIYRSVCMSPGTWYNIIVSSITKKIADKKNNEKRYYFDEEDYKALKKRIDDLETLLSLFNNLINNYRNVVKFYNTFRNNTVICHKLLGAKSNTKETKKYIDSRNIGQILYILSFAEVFLPSEYQRFVQRGANYVEVPLYGSNEPVSKERALLIELTDGMIYGEYFDYQKPNGYIKYDIRLFIDTFITKKSAVHQLVNTFSSQEEKWKEAINNSDVLQLKENWLEIVLMVLQKNPYIHPDVTNTWRIQTFSKLLALAEEQVEKGEWTSDKVFRLFDPDLKTNGCFSAGTGMLTTFWKHLQKSTVYKKPSENLINKIKMFPYHYTQDRLSPMYRLAHYLIPYENNNTESMSIHEHMLNINKKYGDNISLFLDKLIQYIPNCQISGKKWIEKYSDLAQQIVDQLNQQNISQYSDVKNDIELMLDSITEFSSLEKIIDWVEEVDSDVFSSNFRKNTIEQTIQHLESMLSSPPHNKVSAIEQQFLDFFKWLPTVQDVVIDNQQIERLHNLVTLYTDLTGYSSLPYRRLLLNIAANQNNTEVATAQ